MCTRTRVLFCSLLLLSFFVVTGNALGLEPSGSGSSQAVFDLNGVNYRLNQAGLMPGIPWMLKTPALSVAVQLSTCAGEFSSRVNTKSLSSPSIIRCGSRKATAPGVIVGVAVPVAVEVPVTLGVAVSVQVSVMVDVGDRSLYATVRGVGPTVVLEPGAAGGGDVDPFVDRLFGGEGEVQTAMGLNADAFYQMIKQVGNYGEIFERNVGPDTPLGLARGLNALWTEGGLMYPAPFR